MKIILLAALLGVIVNQQPQDPAYDPDGHLKSEHQIPAGHSCTQRQVYEENAARLARSGKKQSAMLHPCDCTYQCHVDENGVAMETGGEKTPKCQAFCSKDGRKCGCHPEEPCDPGHHVARVDMNGQIVSVTR